MPETRDHDFAAPGAPEPASQRMTNEDFRKLMMTPRAGGGASTSSGSAEKLKDKDKATPVGGKGEETPALSDRAEKRKKKKSYYAKLKKQEDDKMAELAAKYRDRARERRDGVDPESAVTNETAADASTAAARREAAAAAAAGTSSSSSGYRAVAPDSKSAYDTAERRKRAIQESKFLGGDMEHTHLVKGLDFALLQKVRSEIVHREKEKQEEEAMVEMEEEEEEEEKASKKDDEKGSDPVTKLESSCRTVMAKNVVKTLFKPDVPKCNEMFFPGRMAYVIELEEEEPGAAGAAAEPTSDIPTTTIRSKADIESGAYASQAATLSTNDIVIGKLTQILSYLRAGSKNRKKKREKMLQNAKDGAFMRAAQSNQRASDAQKAAALADIPIYDDVGEYDPKEASKSSSSSKRRDRDRRDDRRDRDRRDRRDDRRDRDRDDRRDDRSSKKDREHKSSKSRSYFDDDDDEKEVKKEAGDDHKGGLTNQDREYIRRLAEREKTKTKSSRKDAKGGVGLAGAVVEEGATDPDGYNECYPGLAEMADALDDSDDEADYSKMDLGNKKGPIGRWDFETPEEYGDYMSKKEAMPKAAFQYGVKMNEGRKTKGKIGVKNERAKLDREWNKISALIDKRKAPKGGGGSAAKKARGD